MLVDRDVRDPGSSKVMQNNAFFNPADGTLSFLPASANPLVALLGGVVYNLYTAESHPNITPLASLYLGTMFVACMVCHGEVFRLRPGAKRLTGYYLSISAGGAAGGLFVALVAPFVFPDYFELHLAIFLTAALLILVLFLLSFLTVWVRARLAGAEVGLFDLVGMRLRGVPYSVIVDAKIAATKAGLSVDVEKIDAHYLAGGNIVQTVQALIAAQKAGLHLDWNRACAIDIATRGTNKSVLEAVLTSVSPKVIDCPNPASGRTTIDAVAKDGIQVKVKARVTVRTNLDRFVGGDAGLTGVALKDTVTGELSLEPTDGAFVAIGHAPATELFKGKLELDSSGYIVVEAGTPKTAIPGVFACGDVMDHTYRQAVTAAGTGCMAALDAERFVATREFTARG